MTDTGPKLVRSTTTKYNDWHTKLSLAVKAKGKEDEKKLGRKAVFVFHDVMSNLCLSRSGRMKETIAYSRIALQLYGFKVQNGAIFLF